MWYHFIYSLRFHKLIKLKNAFNIIQKWINIILHIKVLILSSATIIFIPFNDFGLFCNLNYYIFSTASSFVCLRCCFCSIFPVPGPLALLHFLKRDFFCYFLFQFHFTCIPSWDVFYNIPLYVLISVFYYALCVRYFNWRWYPKVFKRTPLPFSFVSWSINTLICVVRNLCLKILLPLN